MQEWPDRLEQPVQGALHLVGIAFCRGEITIDVLHGGLDDVQRVAQRLELCARDDELGLAQSKFVAALAALVGALTTRSSTELRRASRPGRNLEVAATPPAPTGPNRFRHRVGT